MYASCLLLVAFDPAASHLLVFGAMMAQSFSITVAYTGYDLLPHSASADADGFVHAIASLGVIDTMRLHIYRLPICSLSISRGATSLD